MKPVSQVVHGPHGSETAQTAQDLYVIDEDGTDETRLTKSDSDPETGTGLGYPVWSPDGNKMAFLSSTWRDTNSDSPESAAASPAPVAGTDGMYVIEMETAGLCKLTRTVDASSSALVWSPDGERIAFVRQGDLFVINTDGTGLKRLASKLAQEYRAVVVSWSRG
jgi:Tol biopolymer transport system component